MNSIRMLNALQDLAALPVHSVICNPLEPRHVALKTSTSRWSLTGREESVRSDALWEMLTAAGEGTVQVLWDPSAPIPEPDPVVWRTTVPGRRPLVKVHKLIGHARAAITNHINIRSRDEMVLEELDPGTGQFHVLHTIPVGTRIIDLPWK